MQASKIKVGEEYAIRIYHDTAVRGRVTRIELMPKTAYKTSGRRPTRVEYDQLNATTGKIEDQDKHTDTTSVVGPWAEYAAEVIAKEAARREAMERRQRNEQRLRAAMSALGVEDDDYRTLQHPGEGYSLIDYHVDSEATSSRVYIRLDLLERLAADATHIVDELKSLKRIHAAL